VRGERLSKRSDFFLTSELIPSASPIRKMIFLFLKFKSKEVSSIELNCLPSSLRQIIILFLSLRLFILKLIIHQEDN